MSFKNNKELINARAFAVKYAGHRIKIDSGMVTFVARNNIVPTAVEFYYGTIIGYSYNLIVIDFEDEAYSSGRLWCDESFIFTVPNKKIGWRIDKKFLQFIINTNPYPNICSICRSPARLNKNISLCSNTKCSIHLQARKRFTYTKKPLPLVDSENYILCPTCGGRAISRTSSRTSDKDVTCGAHDWSWNFEKGQKLQYSKLGSVNSGLKDLVFNGGGFDLLDEHYLYFESLND